MEIFSRVKALGAGHLWPYPMEFFSNVCRGSCNKDALYNRAFPFADQQEAKQTGANKVQTLFVFLWREHQVCTTINLCKPKANEFLDYLSTVSSFLSLICVLGYNVHYLTGNLLQKLCSSSSLMDI
jgi:hypothetical protein